MRTTQQIPASKIVVIETANMHKRFVLCYSLNMGYHIAEFLKTENIVICAATRARRMAEAFRSTAQIYYVDECGQEELVTIHGSEVMEISMLIKDESNQTQNPHKKLGRYTFVNREGNYVRWNIQHGYHIDASSPAEIYSVDTQTEAELACARLNERNYMFEDLRGNTVDSKISIFSQE